MKIFRTTSLDILLIAYAGAAFTAPLLIGGFVPSVWLWLVFAPFQAVFLVIVMNTSLHHHMHVPIFKPQWLNRTYELFVSGVVGIPFHGWKFFHTTHHKYNNDFVVDGKTNDPVSFYRYGSNGQRENFWSYALKGVWRDFSGITTQDKHDTCRTPVVITKQKEIRNEKLAFVIFLGLIAIVNPWYCAFYTGVVYFLSLVLNNANSYGEHFGPAEQSNFRANSVGSYDRLYNLLCFNSGYHQEHHVRPSAHWTTLPSITKTLPKNRHTTNTMYMFNVPWFEDLTNNAKQ